LHRGLRRRRLRAASVDGFSVLANRQFSSLFFGGQLSFWLLGVCGQRSRVTDGACCCRPQCIGVGSRHGRGRATSEGWFSRFRLLPRPVPASAEPHSRPPPLAWRGGATASRALLPRRRRRPARVPCPAGAFAALNRTRAPGAARGGAADPPGGTAWPECVTCPAGHRCSGGGPAPVACGAGAFSAPGFSGAACPPCEAGHHSSRRTGA
jgi:hypothetical protein